MRTKKTEIPQDSLIRAFMPADYDDSFMLEAESAVDAFPDDIMTGIWLDMPGWVNALFKIRNFLVRFVGLKVDGGNSGAELERCIREGGRYGFMEIVAKDPSETVMVMRDKHLDAYMSVRKNGEKSFSVNTLVHYNNSLGRVYFFIIRPFHGVVVRGVLKRTVKSRISR